ncbi:putative concanavalin A-like lectin/glucanase domain-containing protein [Rosa chinensis]|uniref:Putative concanavalin A-like lectin/glucanase domain-containing protein n=1 Tax=Rosa chinensis TaxID=74649 RepID=A0A2P6QT43_ROSCH|nr:putative concanavalin A-like lectin/glucanase domain-containing protein [Rosa chinensis]
MSTGVVTVVALVVVSVMIAIIVVYRRYIRERSSSDDPVLHDPSFSTLTVDNFLNDIERERPMMFTSQQLQIATDNFTNLLGSGGFEGLVQFIKENLVMEPLWQ